MNIAAFLKLPNALDYPLSKPDYFQSYQELGQEIEKLGDTFFIVRGQETYQGNGSFTRSWQFKEGQLVESGPVVVDAIYDKGVFAADDTVPVLNCKDIAFVCTDKWEMYKRFTIWCPKTWMITSHEELMAALMNVTTDIGVVKPVDGEEGHGVFIKDKEDLAELELTYPVLLQEFLDSSVGVPGIVEGLHDFRVAILNGEVIYSYFRTPPTGSYLANVAQGGKFEVIDPQRIPEVFLQVVKKIDAQLAECKHRFYGIDFAMTKDGPKIIEMNSRLGLLPNSDNPVFLKLKQGLASSLHEMAIEKRIE